MDYFIEYISYNYLNIIKAIHIIFVISWLAGMLYLPRLFVYHCQLNAKGQPADIFKVMERKLLKFIINPAMIITLITGLWLAVAIYNLQGTWLHLKLLLVFLLLGIHGFLTKSVKSFAKDMNKYSEKFWRIINEVPAILMMIIVFLVVLKPF